jgi:hypothetical protein
VPLEDPVVAVMQQQHNGLVVPVRLDRETTVVQEPLVLHPRQVQAEGGQLQDIQQGLLLTAVAQAVAGKTF